VTRRSTSLLSRLWVEHSEHTKALSTSTIQSPSSSTVTESLRRPHREHPSSLLESCSAMQPMVPASVSPSGGWWDTAPSRPELGPERSDPTLRRPSVAGDSQLNDLSRLDLGSWRGSLGQDRSGRALSAGPGRRGRPPARGKPDRRECLVRLAQRHADDVGHGYQVEDHSSLGALQLQDDDRCRGGRFRRGGGRRRKCEQGACLWDAAPSTHCKGREQTQDCHRHSRAENDQGSTH
jgi:hypothetical protein